MTSRSSRRNTRNAHFLVEFETGRSLLDLSGLKLDLEEKLGCEVDVATPGSLHPAMKDDILGELVSIL